MICNDVLKIIHGDLSEIDDPEGFADHLSSCEKCWREFDKIYSPAGIIKQFIKPDRSSKEKMLIFLETIKALKSKGEQYIVDRDVQALVTKAETLQKEVKYKEAIKCLEEALTLKPGDEEIDEKIKRLKLPEIYIDGIQQDVGSISNMICSSIHTAGEIIIKYLGKVEFKKRFGNEDLFNEEDSLIFESKKMESIEFETDSLKITIFKGKDVSSLEILIRTNRT